MRPALKILGGLGLGAGLMYYFDPQRGRSQRALVRDKIVRAGRVANRAADVTARDTGNRVRDLWAERSR